MNFYERFCAACKNKEIAFSAAAEKAGLDKSVVNYWKNHLTSTPKYETLQRIAGVLDVTVGYLQGKEPLGAKDFWDAIAAGDYKRILELLEQPDIASLTSQGMRDYYKALAAAKTTQDRNLIHLQEHLAAIIDEDFTDEECKLYEELTFWFSHLSKEGKEEAINRIHELAQISKYRQGEHYEWDFETNSYGKD